MTGSRLASGPLFALALWSCGVRGAENPAPQKPPLLTPGAPVSTRSPSPDTLAPQPHYEPESTPPPAPIQSENLTWPPAGLVARAGAPECRRWQQPLQTACSAKGRALEALLAIAEQVERGADLREVARARAPSPDPRTWSEQLRGLEGCSDLPVGLVRLLRTQWFPECSAELASGALAGKPQPMSQDTRAALYGTALGANARRVPVPMPRYQGEFEASRFAHFVLTRLRPWQEQTQQALARWRAAMNALPRGSYGRAVATLGLGVATRRFLRQHRDAPIADTLKQHYEQRKAYYGAIDELGEPVRVELSALTAEAVEEFAVQGNYGSNEQALELDSLFNSASERLHRLALPSLEPYSASLETRVARYIPLPTSLTLLGQDQLRRPEVLRALLAQGLPLTVRAAVGTRLAQGEVAPAEAQVLRELLASGSIRLGLITRARRPFARAELELDALPPSPIRRFLSELSRVLARSGQGQFVDLRGVSGSPELTALGQPSLEIAGGSELDAMRRLNASLLRVASAGPNPEDVNLLHSLAEGPGLAEPQRRCIRDLLERCSLFSVGVGARRDDEGACHCVPWNWRLPLEQQLR